MDTIIYKSSLEELVQQDFFVEDITPFHEHITSGPVSFGPANDDPFRISEYTQDLFRLLLRGEEIRTYVKNNNGNLITSDKILILIRSFLRNECYFDLYNTGDFADFVKFNELPLQEQEKIRNIEVKMQDISDRTPDEVYILMQRNA